jgi:hypothetical protein
VEDFVEAIEDAFQFQPKPGGMVDRHRKAEARRKEAEQEQENIDAKGTAVL